MNEFDLATARRSLSRTPKALDAWLRDLPDARARQNEGPDTWSPFDIVGHMNHGERTDWVPRARIILEHGASKAFEPFDRFAQMALSEDETLNGRLDVFATLRAQNLAALDELHIAPEQLALEGRHPELGSVTLQQLIATWVVHDLSHVAQIARVMAKGYRAEVGPWAAYVPLLGSK